MQTKLQECTQKEVSDLAKAEEATDSILYMAQLFAIDSPLFYKVFIFAVNRNRAMHGKIDQVPANVLKIWCDTIKDALCHEQVYKVYHFLQVTRIKFYGEWNPIEVIEKYLELYIPQDKIL